MRRIRAAALAATLVFTLFACGGDDDDESADTSSTTEAPAEDEGGDEDESGLGGAFNSEECRDLQDAFEAAASSASGPPSEGPENLEETREFFDELVDRVPSEIRDDFETYAEAIGDYLDRLEDLDIDSENPDPDDVQEAIRAAQALATSDVIEASTNISQFIVEDCGTG